MENQTHILTLVKKLMIKILNWKFIVLLQYQNIKKIFSGHMLLVTLKAKKLLERVTKKLQKTDQKSLELKK